MHSLPSFFRQLVFAISLLLAVFRLPLLAEDPKQGSELVPKKTDDGVLFQFSAPGATAVYLAGDFNSWANNTNGKITGSEGKMDGPDGQGIWRKTVKLEQGKHAFKFNLDGAENQWLVPDWANLDKDGNAILTVTESGEVAGLKEAAATTAGSEDAVPVEMSPQQKDGRVTFSFMAADATTVYLAADFNNWADNQQGSVTESKYAMSKVGTEGLWQTQVTVQPGSHSYKFVVDGVRWENDPHAISKDVDGNSILEVN